MIACERVEQQEVWKKAGMLTASLCEPSVRVRLAWDGGAQISAISSEPGSIVGAHLHLNRMWYGPVLMKAALHFLLLFFPLCVGRLGGRIV